MNVNVVFIGGNLTRDVELRFTQGGTAIGQFSVAVNKRWTKDGEKKEKTTFLDCKAFGKTAETIAQYFKKGSRFYGQGEIDVESWEDKQTQQKRYKAVVQINSFEFVDRAQSGGQHEPPPRQRPTAPSSPTPDQGNIDDDGGDVPFAFPPRKFNHYRLA